MDKKELIYLPIIHTSKDMGDLSDSIRQVAMDVLGKQSLRQKDQLVNQIWTAIEQTIDALALPFDKVRLYQDGLPICGREIEIVTDLADGGSRNHRLLVRMIRKGALLMGTESAELLLEEYRLIKQTVSGQYGDRANEKPADLKRKADLLLKKRDQFIARRINDTLGSGETGIVFLGMLHNLEGFLDNEIQLIYPIANLFSNRGNK
jgi:hypothetical protein